MAEEFNIVLEHLKAIRGDIGDLKDGQRLIERRLTALEEHMSVLVRTVTHHESDFASMRQRIERIERRLDLHDPQH